MAAKSKLGQNFLRDTAAIQRILNTLGDLSQRTVVEIGPGRGAITEGLAARAGRLIAVEYDRELAWALQERFSPEKGGTNVTVVKKDILEFDFEAAAKAAGQPLIVVGNLPYYITSPILLHLAHHAAHLEQAVLMVQREVADRITADPGSREYGLLTASLQMYGKATSLFTLPPEAFNPPPEVHSTVFRWQFSPHWQQLGVIETEFMTFLKLAFAQKRKTLANNLRAGRYPADKVAAAFERTGISPMIRAEALSLRDFAGIALALSDH